jgi:FkbM family methyltransferase
MRPLYDNKLKQVDVFVADMDKAISLCRNRGTAVQAGGALGLWPLHLSSRFNSVYTFEPNELNYQCLEYNCRGAANVYAHRAALGLRNGGVDLAQDPAEADNAGTWHTVGDGSSGPVLQLCIDAMGSLGSLDFLCLDVEGRELDVIQGAVTAIKRHRPVIQLECKALPHMLHRPEDVIAHLKGMGYREVHRIKRDIVFQHESQL